MIIIQKLQTRIVNVFEMQILIAVMQHTKYKEHYLMLNKSSLTINVRLSVRMSAHYADDQYHFIEKNLLNCTIGVDYQDLILLFSLY